ncbi:hypothetical protein Tcan_17516 [Toxocara canis]|uniref:Uncharacterized protein n=1 Tax=Toxocara canis TaxID=6265 RepID=A0A0B2V353_TOXCA|nr:hypothetical protein Tcan_17516 [Toxocara canis]
MNLEFIKTWLTPYVIRRAWNATIDRNADEGEFEKLSHINRGRLLTVDIGGMRIGARMLDGPPVPVPVN